MSWPFQMSPRVICWLGRHVPILERDAAGALRWVCRRCRQELGATVLGIPARPPAEPLRLP